MTNLRFADDIMLVGRTLPQIRSMIADVARAAAEVGLELHPEKTKILHNGIGYGAGVTQTSCNGMSIEVLDCQKHAMYLGRALCLRGMHGEELRNRTSKAWSKFGIHKDELTDRDIPIRQRLRLFDAMVTPTTLYGSGAWTMTVERHRHLRSTQRRMMRMILNSNRKYKGDQRTVEDFVEWIQRTTREAEELMARYSINDWVTQQRDRVWQWAGKVARSTDGRWSHKILNYEPLGSRLNGRPRARWTDQITSFLRQKMGNTIDANTWILLAKDRSKWDDWQTEFSAEPI